MIGLNFKVVSNEIVSDWDKTGKQQVLSKCLEILHSQKSFVNTAKDRDVRRILYEVIWQLLQKKLKNDNVVSLITSIKEKHPRISSTMVDVFSMVDTEIVATGVKLYRDRLVSLITSCRDIVGIQLLKERLDVETLEALKLISNTKQFQQKYIKTKTRLFYKQQKFNLLREEMEGYSKLAAELGQLENKDEGAVYLLENIKSLIGCFNIDPNRVLDIILEAFECHPQFAIQVFVPLLNNYLLLCERSTICQLLGFKFAHYQEVGLKTPESLYTVAALLIQHDLVDLDDLLLHLVPGDDDLVAEWTKIVDAAKEKVRKMNIVSLSGADKADESEDKPEPPKLENQKFGLCEGLLRVGDWINAKKLLGCYETNHMMAQDTLVHALCHLIAAMVDPFYRRVASVKGSLSLPAATLKHGTVSHRVEKYEDLTENIFSMLDVLGPRLSLDPLLMAKIVRIGRMFFSEYHSSDTVQQNRWRAVYGGFLGATANVFLPALSLLQSNANMSEEVWVMLQVLPYQQRYRLYGEWKNDAYARHPDMMLAQANTVDRTKYIMRRLTKENVKQSGRQMGKLSHGNPVVLFDCILNQIQRYDNMINPVVDAFKYLTNLTYDALAFCIIEALANPQKERMKYDDTNISDWLQSLASFSGAVFKKYSIELSGLLQYVANQLKAGKSLDLLILKEVVQKMSGVEVSEEVTKDQLEALGGGELLKAEGGYFGQIRNTKKSSNRLKEALLGQKLELPMCVLISQHRHAIVFEEGEQKHLKLVGKLTDQCHDTLVQFGNFLSIHLSMDEYVKRFPPIDTLAREYHTPVDVAFFLSRPMYAHQISSKYDEMRRQEKSKSQKSTSQEKNARFVNACRAVMAPVCDMIKGTQPDKIWQDVSPQFYATFWSLSLFDVQVPGEAYDREIAKLKQQVDDMQQEGSHDNRKRRERERCESLAAKLKEEQRKQEEHRARVRARLKSERESWFLARTSKNDAITKFLQLCVFPRCVFSPLDAVYCARFVHLMHLLRTPNFSTLLCFDRVFSDISYTVTCFSENEASRYGRFLCSMLEIVVKWHKDRDVYEKECKNYPGFVTVLRTNATDGASKANHLDYENFRHVCHKWQFKLTKALVVCLDSKEYCAIRNALVILTKILPCFPMVTALGSALEKRVEKIKEEKEKRPDLYALAMGYSGQLRARRQFMVPEQEFHLKDATKANQARSKHADGDAKAKVKTENEETKRSKSQTKEKRESIDKVKERAKSRDKISADSDVGVSNTNAVPDKEPRKSSVAKSPVKSRGSSATRAVDGDERDRKRRKVDAGAKAEGRKEKRSKSSTRDEDERRAAKEAKRARADNGGAGGDEGRAREKHRKSDGGEKGKKSVERESRKERGARHAR